MENKDNIVYDDWAINIIKEIQNENKNKERRLIIWL